MLEMGTSRPGYFSLLSYKIFKYNYKIFHMRWYSFVFCSFQVNYSYCTDFSLTRPSPTPCSRTTIVSAIHSIRAYSSCFDSCISPGVYPHLNVLQCTLSLLYHTSHIIQTHHIMTSKSRPKFTTSNVGRPKPWNKKQQQIIDSSLPQWHDFALVQNEHIDGRDLKFIRWKKMEADRILQLPEFAPLPEGVSVTKI
jgi:hypothetical protein